MAKEHETIDIDYSKTQATVCYLVKDGKVLLMEKGRNLGKGKLTGVGGRQEEEDQTLEDTSNREVLEEIGVNVTSMKKGGLLDFVFPHNPKFSQLVTAYVADGWVGEPQVTEEAVALHWFDIDNLPTERMWHDNSFWLPTVLDGRQVQGRFVIGEDNRVIEHTLEVLPQQEDN